MKKYILNLIILLSVSALLWNCGEDFLEQDKPLVSTEAIIFRDAEKTEMTLLGLYSSVKGDYCNYLGGRTFIAFDNRGDDIVNIDPNLVTLFYTYMMLVNSSNTEVEEAWYYAYLAINRANVFIEAIKEYKTAEIIGDQLASQYVAEAKFIRALSYYYLLQLYSQPYKLDRNARAFPLRLTAIKGGGQSHCPSSTNAKIYAAILDDLSNSEIAALPADAGIKNRATKAAANMLKMRVCMAMENWADAISAGEAITGYQLVSDVTAMFSPPYNTNESIFSLAMSDNDQPGTQRAPSNYYTTGRICIIDKANGVMSKSNYSLPGDKRVMAFDKDGRLAKYDDGILISTPIFRFAETKLNLAECYAQSNRAADARTALTDVRRRSIPVAADLLDISSLSGAALLEAITDEKRLEFIGEGMRGIEIIRKGENFIKLSASPAVNVAPTSSFYTWPIPDNERVNNSLWNELAP